MNASVGRIANRADGVEPQVGAVELGVLHQHVLRDVDRRVLANEVHALGRVDERTSGRLHRQNRSRPARAGRSKNRDHFGRPGSGVAEDHVAGPLAAHKQLLIGDRHDRHNGLGEVDGEGRAEDPASGVPVVGVVDRARIQPIRVALRSGDDRARAPERKHLRVRRARRGVTRKAAVRRRPREGGSVHQVNLASLAAAHRVDGPEILRHAHLPGLTKHAGRNRGHAGPVEGREHAPVVADRDKRVPDRSVVSHQFAHLRAVHGRAVHVRADRQRAERDVGWFGGVCVAEGDNRRAGGDGRRDGVVGVLHLKREGGRCRKPVRDGLNGRLRDTHDDAPDGEIGVGRAAVAHDADFPARSPVGRAGRHHADVVGVGARLERDTARGRRLQAVTVPRRAIDARVGECAAGAVPGPCHGVPWPPLMM